MTTVNDMTKAQLIRELAATYETDQAGWAHFYASWTAESLRRALTKRTAYVSQKATVSTIFDPDEALRKIRECVDHAGGYASFDEMDLVDTIKGLDHWISSGGSLPSAWNRHA